MEKDIQNDQELYSYFVQRNATLCEDNFGYLIEHKEIKLMINDYLSNLLLQKPDDVFKFTKDYFRILSEKPEINKIIFVVGPDGVGKASLIEKLMNDMPDKFEYPNLCTTKTQHKENYYFVEKEKFLEMINEDEFIDYNFDNDEYEGITKSEINRIFETGKISIIKVGINEAIKFYHQGLPATYIAIVPPSIETLRERLRIIKKGNTATINKILEASAKEILEIETSSFFTQKIINDDFDTGFEDFKKSITSAFPFLKSEYKEIEEFAMGKLNFNSSARKSSNNNI